ncbi:uncharacterized protein LOC100186162 isoform X2 [Ciona intestinalis]
MEFPFAIWNAPGVGYIPLVNHRNTEDRLQIFNENEKTFADTLVGENVMQHCENLKKNLLQFQEESYENAVEHIRNIRQGNTEKDITHVPKTPRTVKKTRRRRVVKPEQSVQPLRRSTRCTRASVRLDSSLFSDLSLDQSRSSLSKVDTVVAEITKSRSKKKSLKRKKATIVVPTIDELKEGVEETSVSDAVASKSETVTQTVEHLIQFHEQEIDVHTDKQPQPTSSSKTHAVVDVNTSEALYSETPMPTRPKRKGRSSARRSITNQLTNHSKTISRKSKTTNNRKSLIQILRKSLANENLIVNEESGENGCEQMHGIVEKTAVVVVERMETSEPEQNTLDQENEETVSNATITTSQTGTLNETGEMSTSTCSSSAATIELNEKPTDQLSVDDIVQNRSFPVFSVSDTEEEGKPTMSPVHEQEPIKVKKSSRTSVRASRRVISTALRRSSVRRSTRINPGMAQTGEVILQDIETDIKDIASTDDSSQDESEHEIDTVQMKTGPKIAKPVIKAKPQLRLRRPPVVRTVGQLKRTRAIMNMNGSFDYGNKNSCSTPSPPKQKRSSPGTTTLVQKYVQSINRNQRLCNMPRTNSFLNRSTASSRARRTPGLASPAPSNRPPPSPMYRTPGASNNITTVRSFLLRNTPERVNKEMEIEMKKKQLEEKKRKEEERKQKIREEKTKKQEEAKRKREERWKKVYEQRELRERAEKEKQEQNQDKWNQRIADADRTKNQRKMEENVKMQKEMEKLAKAEARRKEEEEEKAKKLKEQEEERERKLRNLQLERKLAEEQRAKERKLEDERKEEQRRLEEEKQKEEKMLEENKKRQLEEERVRIQEEEKMRKRHEQIEIERAKKKREEELALELAQKKKKQEEAQKLKEKRELARKEAEAARKKKLEERRLAREEEKRLKEKEKREKEEKKRQKEELLKQQKEEEELAREQEEMRRRQEEARIIQEEQARLQAAEKERLQKKAEAQKKKEKLRKKVEEERRLREEKQKQEQMAEEEERQKQRKDNEYQRKLKEAEVRLQKLQESYLVPPTMSSTMNTPSCNDTFTVPADTTLDNNYNMTPRGPDRPLLPSTSENYNIDDFQSGDSTDQEDEPKKVVPQWAKSYKLHSAIIKQYYSPPDLDKVFPGLLRPVELNKLFKKTKPRYFKRTSSAHWTHPIMPPGHISFTEQCQGFR